MRRVLSLATIFFLTSISAGAYDLFKGDYKIEGLKAGVFKGYENHPDAKRCPEFTMTEAQVRKFFSKAKLITTKQEDDKFKWNPCQVTGTVVKGKEKINFEIFASKEANLRYPNGKLKMLGCMECGKPFFEF